MRPPLSKESSIASRCLCGCTTCEEALVVNQGNRVAAIAGRSLLVLCFACGNEADERPTCDRAGTAFYFAQSAASAEIEADRSHLQLRLGGVGRTTWFSGGPRRVRLARGHGDLRYAVFIDSLPSFAIPKLAMPSPRPT
jgi:hypothetical protein